MSQRAAWAVGFSLLLVASGGVAAALAAVAPATHSVVAVQVLAAPYELQAGAGASRSRFVDDFQLSENRTSFSVRIQAKAGGDMVVRDVFRVASASGASRSITLRGDGVSESAVVAYTWTVREGETAVATLDLKTGSPSATFTLPGATTDQVDLRIKLQKGAGANDASVASAVWSVTG